MSSDSRRFDDAKEVSNEEDDSGVAVAADPVVVFRSMAEESSGS